MALHTPEGVLEGVVEICKFLVKGTSLLDDCSYLEKSEVAIRSSCLFLEFCRGLPRVVQTVCWRFEGRVGLLL